MDDNGMALEGGRLRSGRIFRSGKRRTITRGSCNTTRQEDYELNSHFDEVSCDKEYAYKSISERE